MSTAGRESVLGQQAWELELTSGGGFEAAVPGCRRRQGETGGQGWSQSSFYSLPGPRLCRIAEPPPDPISEAELSQIWEGLRFPPGALATAAGEPVEVVFPGRHGGAAGPDFRDAVVRFGGHERRGDVELHVRASYFRGHGHHLDPAYDGLALHVVYLADDGPATALSNGATSPVAAFAPWVEQRSADLQRWLEGPPLWREPCWDAVERLGAASVHSVLAASGTGRFAAKVDSMEAAVTGLGEEQALWQALLEACGYGGDRGGYRRLARALPAALALELTAPQMPPRRFLLEAALLAVAGLAPSPPAIAHRLPRPLVPPLAGTSRPANRPQRRLAAFAALFERAGGAFGPYAETTVAAAESADALIAAWQVDGLLGRERAAELVLNVVLPFAATRPALAGAALRLAAALPVQRAYGKTAFLERNLRLSTGRRLVRSAVEQQGLLAMLSDWCSQGGCGRCPLSWHRGDAPHP